MKRSPVLFPDASGLIHGPASLIKKLIGTLHIIGVSDSAANIGIRCAVRNNRIGYRLIAIGQALGDCFFVDGIGQRLPHAQIRQIAIEVQGQIYPQSLQWQ